MTVRLRAPMPLFTAGALLYAAAAAVWMTMVPDGALNAVELLIPLFGVPFLLLGRCPRWRTALYLLLLVPTFHFAAVTAAMHSLDGMGRNGLLPPGAVGGLTGATLSFLALVILRLASWRSAGTMAVGIAVLTLLGYVGIDKMDFLQGTRWSGYDVLLALYLPWQIAFGFFLSRLLRVPPKVEPAACPNPNGAP
ncbi:MAG TPA: hypothetical protein VKI45_03090 [Allosphingosinicella sp.]|nr:hypothetical protein [Allosphingosinicella sp.]